MRLSAIGQRSSAQDCFHDLEQALGREWLWEAGEAKPGIGVVVRERSGAGSYDDGQRQASAARTRRQFQTGQSGHLAVCNQQLVFLASQRLPASQAVLSQVHAI